jgi:hypothetical protein
MALDVLDLCAPRLRDAAVELLVPLLERLVEVLEGFARHHDVMVYTLDIAAVGTAVPVLMQLLEEVQTCTLKAALGEHTRLLAALWGVVLEHGLDQRAGQRAGQRRALSRRLGRRSQDITSCRGRVLEGEVRNVDVPVHARPF